MKKPEHNAKRDSDGRFSVAIVNLNGEATICRAILSAIAEGVPEHNVVVIDDGCTDASLQSIHARFPLVKMHFNKSDLGLPKLATGLMLKRGSSSEGSNRFSIVKVETESF